MKNSKSSSKINIDAFKSTTACVLQNKGMELEDPEISASEDEEDDTRKHQKLLQGIEKTNGKRCKVFQRNEVNEDVTEADLIAFQKDRPKRNELTQGFKQITSFMTVKEKLKRAARSKRLQVPLSKPQAEKIKRTLAYTKVTEEVTKWDPIVKNNKMAEKMIYPLKEPEFRLETMENIAKRYTNKNAFEKEVSELLENSENTLVQSKELTKAEERALKAMSLKEAKQRLSELQKTRALLSYKEAKLRRQSKIKSKKFHRVLKKEKMKTLLKDFEELQKSNPDEAQEKLRELDRQRILERVTLKHRNTGKWAKYQKLRAKYNPESRHLIKEQAELSRKLTEKIVQPEMLHEEIMEAQEVIEPELLLEGEMERETGGTLEQGASIDAVEPQVSVEEAVEPKIPVEEAMEPEMTVEKAVESEMSVEGTTESEALIKNVMPKNVIRKPGKKNACKGGKQQIQKNVSTNITKQKKNYVCEERFSSDVIIIDSVTPDLVTFGDENDSPEGLLNIQEAYDGDLVSDFREEKEAVRKKEQPEGINLLLPGWGSWGGCGIKPSNKKRKRFFIKPVTVVRKDSTLGNVIISEEKDTKASAHQVDALPFPFTNVHQFQCTMRQPVGNTWNPETSFKNLIAPKVITKLGKIIHPIDADDVVLQKSGEGNDCSPVKRKVYNRKFTHKKKEFSDKK